MKVIFISVLMQVMAIFIEPFNSITVDMRWQYYRWEYLLFMILSILSSIVYFCKFSNQWKLFSFFPSTTWFNCSAFSGPADYLADLKYPHVSRILSAFQAMAGLHSLLLFPSEEKNDRCNLYSLFKISVTHLEYGFDPPNSVIDPSLNRFITRQFIELRSFFFFFYLVDQVVRSSSGPNT